MKFLSYFLAAILGALVAAVVLSHWPAGQEQKGLSEAQRKAVEATIESYLGQHPDIVAKAIDRLHEQQVVAAHNAVRTAIRDNADSLLHDVADQVLGNPQGNVTVVEFFDYRCPYCKRVTPDLLATLKSDGNIRLVLKEFPILGPDSVLAAHAAVASIKQGKYAAFHLALLAAPTALNAGTIMSIAEATGLDTTRLAADMKDPAIDTTIKRNYALAQALKIEGTPAFVIGDELVPGVLDAQELERLVKAARGKG